MAPSIRSKRADSSIRYRPESEDLPGSVYLIASDGRVLSLPIPSQSRHDPLNWGVRKRTMALLALGAFSCVNLVLAQGASLMMNGLTEEFESQATRPFRIDTFVSAPTLFMGIGAFIWIPLTLAVGRRPVFVICAILMVLAALGAAFARTYFELLAAISVIGMTEGFALSGVLLMIIDLTFIHQRPQAIAIVWAVAGFAAQGGLATTPYLTQHGVKWRNFYTIWSIPAAISCIMVFLFYPETYFKRPAVAFDGRMVLQTAAEQIIIYDTDDDESMGKNLPDAPKQTVWLRILERLRVPRASCGRWKAMWRCYAQILFCFCNPLIFWIAFSNAINFAAMMFIGETYAMTMTAEPYKLPSHLIILVNLSSGTGSLLAWPAGGIAVCRILKYLSRRNKGVREAEHYLIAFVLPVLAGAASALLYGLTVQQKWHYSLFYVAYGLNGFSYAGLSIANTLWVTEAFPQWAAPALVVVGGASYCASFGLSFVLIPWIHSQGYMKVGIQLALMQLGLGGVLVPLAFWGKQARQYIHGRVGSWRDGALRPQ